MSEIIKNIKEFIETVGMGITIYQDARRGSAERRDRKLKKIRDMMYAKN